MGSTLDPWLETPWEKDDVLAMWHKRHVPYSVNSLQHLDVWVPVREQTSSPPSSWTPSDSTWAIYIHGGAWRDPLVTSDALSPALGKLSAASVSSARKFAFASISYSLSPYPEHETCPSDPTDAARNARHPQHAEDVAAALSYLQALAGFGDNYVLIGHSCGATLAFQAAMTKASWHYSSSLVPPRTIVGLNGLYALPELVFNPGDKHSSLKSVYELLVRNAFGDDQDVWKDASPASAPGGWATQWPGTKRVLLLQSVEDQLVPFAQAERLRDALVAAGDRFSVELVQGVGKHDDPWHKGDILAEVLDRIMSDADLTK